MKRNPNGQGGESFGTQRLPGTGGDLRAPELRRDPEVDGLRRDEQDVEGHLYTSGPSTKGEFLRRAPETPHGERHDS